jgi:hypothetical protein
LVLSETILRLALGILLASDSLFSCSFFRHSRESGNPGPSSLGLPWIPAFAGMTT